MKKHILYLTQYYITENQSGGQRHFHNVNALVEAGYRVTVITCFVDYIKREVPKEYEGKKVVKEEVNENLTVYKTYAYPGYGKDVLSRLRNMCSYSYNAYNVAFKIKDIDLIIASSPPLPLGLSAYCLSCIKNKRFIFEVRDLWPDTPVQMKTLNNKYLIYIAKIIEKLSYSKSCAIIGLTQGICKGIIDKGTPVDKVHFIPNGADINIYLDIDDTKPLSLVRNNSEEFIITYAGVHSSYPDLQNFLNVANLLKDYPDIKIVLVGDGDNKPELVRMKEELNLNNVHLFGMQPKKDIPKILASSNACLISYQDLELWRGAFPNKTFDYMASKRPIIASVLEGEITDLITKADCGLCVKPSNPEKLKEAILWMYNNQDKLSQLGNNGRKYVEEHYNRNNIIKNYLALVEKYV